MVSPEPAQHQLLFSWACMAMPRRLAALGAAAVPPAVRVCAGGARGAAEAGAVAVSVVSAAAVSAAADSRLRREWRAWGARVMAFLPKRGVRGERSASGCC